MSSGDDDGDVETGDMQTTYSFCLLLAQPCFDMFYSHVQKLITTDVTLGQMERFSLVEALVLIINQFKDYDKQKAFLDQMLGPLITDWTSDEMSQSVIPSYSCIFEFLPLPFFFKLNQLFLYVPEW